MAKKPAKEFWVQLKQLSFDGPYSRVKDSGRTVSDEQVKLEGEKWGAQLGELPFDETISLFTIMINDWLHRCDLTHFTDKGESEYYVMCKCYLWWGAWLEAE